MLLWSEQSAWFLSWLGSVSSPTTDWALVIFILDFWERNPKTCLIRPSKFSLKWDFSVGLTKGIKLCIADSTNLIPLTDFRVTLCLKSVKVLNTGLLNIKWMTVQCSLFRLVLSFCAIATVGVIKSCHTRRSLFLGRFWTKIQSEGWHCSSSNFVYNFVLLKL